MTPGEGDLESTLVIERRRWLNGPPRSSTPWISQLKTLPVRLSP